MRSDGKGHGDFVLKRIGGWCKPTDKLMISASGAFGEEPKGGALYSVGKEVGGFSVNLGGNTEFNLSSHAWTKGFLFCTVKLWMKKKVFYPPFEKALSF